LEGLKSANKPMRGLTSM